jgi:hypothetical protein
MATIFHRIKAYLYKNPLTENPNDYTIRVASERSLNVSEVCEVAVTRGGADITAAAMSHSVDLFLKEMAYQLCDGFAINTGWFTASVHVKGTVDSPVEHYDPDKQTIVFEFHQGTLMRREIPGISIDILGVAQVDGSIAQVVDVKTGSVNNLLTPGRNLRIAGDKIKIAGDPAKEPIGVYFRNLAKGDVVQVDPSDIVVNNPSELIIVIPALDPTSAWQLEVVTQFAVGKLLKQPRTITFDQPLTPA